MTQDCKGGAEVGFDWDSWLVLHENDDDWHDAPPPPVDEPTA